MKQEELYNESIDLLGQMIRIPSFSREEDNVADLIASYLDAKQVRFYRSGNNIYAFNKFHNPAKPTVLLNSHIDTVKPANGYTRDPFAATTENGRLYGLGSNDAGASVVSLIAAFLYYYEYENLGVNLVLAVSCEEEVSGQNGLESILDKLGDIDLAIVGEPTGMNPAIAERGLLVLDCVAHGKAGHAAREEGDNAIYHALKDIEWIRNYKFPKSSPLFGDMKMNVTMISAGVAHNVIPEECRFTVDIRINEHYTHQQVIDIVRENIKSDVNPRSTRLKPSSIDPNHKIVKFLESLGKVSYGSPTTSDQALLSVPSVKLGPGDSSRSHAADEYITLDEIKEAIDIYIKAIAQL